MAVQPIPEGYHSVTPYLAVDDASRAIDWYKTALGATERVRMSGPDGKIMHAELDLGDSVVMLADPSPQSSSRPPKELGGSTAGILLYVEDVDAVVDRAVGVGAELRMPPENMFWGDRFGSITDPFGHTWQIATHVEDVSPDEMERRSREFTAAAT